MDFIINEGAKAHEGVIPEDCYHVPYMSLEELRQEITSMIFYGYAITKGGDSRYGTPTHR